MYLTRAEKENLKRQLADSLRHEPEITKIVVYGSFLAVEDPHDLDVAVFQNSRQVYLPLAMKYRRKTRSIARLIPLDIIPLRPGATGVMLDAIALGEVVYENINHRG